MNASDLIAYLQTVLAEAGDIPIVVQPREAHAHLLKVPEVIDRQRYWADKSLERTKAVVIR